MIKSIPSIEVLNIPIACVTQKSILRQIDKLINKKEQIFIATPNPEHVILAQKDISFFDILQNTDINIPDGIGVVWAAKKRLKTKSNNLAIERVTGIDLMFQLCQYATVHKMRIGLLGGSRGIAAKVIDNLKKKIPQIDILAFPYYEYGKEDTEIIQKIQNSKVSILFVALGAPKQELFISKYLKYMLNIRLAMGVGGAFDVYGGALKRPPLWIQNLNVEWLYRLIQEPSRLKRQLNLIKFTWQVIKSQ